MAYMHAKLVVLKMKKFGPRILLLIIYLTYNQTLCLHVFSTHPHTYPPFEMHFSENPGCERGKKFTVSLPTMHLVRSSMLHCRVKSHTGCYL